MEVLAQDHLLRKSTFLFPEPEKSFYELDAMNASEAKTHFISLTALGSNLTVLLKKICQHLAFQP